jgi:MinD superfamily P-loop ATPase
LKIAVLSGKGGTGKTLVSVNLAVVCPESAYIDCDVEEPNGHIFLKPKISNEYDVSVLIPVCNDENCTGCRTCVDFCNFNALAYVRGRLMIFSDICHSCGGCMLVCPEGAIYEKEKNIGCIKAGNSQGTAVYSGIMNTGEESGVPIINELLKIETYVDNIFIDCPPGSSCTVMESIRDAEYCILVTEPTVLGLHDFKMVYELVKLFNKPFGVVLNKCTGDYNPSKQYCTDEGIKVLAEIPYDSELAVLNSNGKVVARANPRFKSLFEKILTNIEKEVCR